MAAGFPTTVAPIVQVGAVPVFIDADPITGNARCDQRAGLQPGQNQGCDDDPRPGNPFDLATTLAFCRQHNLWLVEDNCDALGCSYSMPRDWPKAFQENSPGLDEGPDRVVRWTGTWGDLSTQSFYPPHHLTMGEGGVNIVRDAKLKVIAESRDWGRDYWCPAASTTLAISALAGSWANCPRVTTTSTPTATWATTQAARSSGGDWPSATHRLPEFTRLVKTGRCCAKGLQLLNVLEFALPTLTNWHPEEAFLGRQ